VPFVDPTDARNKIVSPFATSSAIGSSVQPIYEEFKPELVGARVREARSWLGSS
jgi:hypothetical protein